MIRRQFQEGQEQIALGTFTNGVGMKFIRLPGVVTAEGERVYVSADLVTQKDYRAVMNGNPSYFKGENLPVERVSWRDAMAFCGELGHREGRRYRLPFEREWEAACQAGGLGPLLAGHGAVEMHRGGCCGGEEAAEKIERPEKTAPVRAYGANGWGFYDLPGNVWEWCADSADEKTGRAILRGGSWIFNAGGCGEENRGVADLDARENDIGFRVVLLKDG